MSEIGIYILTYPGDYYLSTALIGSLRHFGLNVPIMIIPGEGFEHDDHPFDVPIMPIPGGFWSQMGHIDRKFWSFQGPFEKFVYIDADIICTRPIATFIEQLKQQNSKFINVGISFDDAEWCQAINNSEHKLHQHCINRVHSQLGNVDLLNEFDPDYDAYAHYPFNAGLFASSRLAIDEKSFENLYNKEKNFFMNRLNKEFGWECHDLFFADQGRLNYLVDRLDIARLPLAPYGNYMWGGEPVEVLLDQVLTGKAGCNYVHWAGCPRPNPSLFCKWPLLPLLTLAYPQLPARYKTLKEIPAYSVWKYFATEEHQKWTLTDLVKWTWRDAKLILNRTLRSLVRPLKLKSPR